VIDGEASAQAVAAQILEALTERAWMS